MRNQIYITGDTHRMLDASKIQTFRDTKRSEDCEYLIILGDFGAPFEPFMRRDEEYQFSKWDQAAINFYDSLPFKVLYLDGNHENFDFIKTMPVTEMFGGKVQKLTENVTHLMRGEIYTINGKTFWTFGGADSIDKYSRIEGFTWWKEEVASYAEMEYGMQNLEKHGNEVDYVLTHTPTKKAIYRLIHQESVCPVANYLDMIQKNIKYKRWYCGHMHADVEYECWNMVLLYNLIEKLE